MLIATIVYVGLCAATALLAVYLVGKPRPPVTPFTAAGAIVGQALGIAYVLWLYSAAAGR